MSTTQELNSKDYAPYTDRFATWYVRDGGMSVCGICARGCAARDPEWFKMYYVPCVNPNGHEFCIYCDRVTSTVQRDWLWFNSWQETEHGGKTRWED